MDRGKRIGSISMEYMKEILAMGSLDKEQVVHCDCSYVRMKWNEIKSMCLNVLWSWGDEIECALIDLIS